MELGVGLKLGRLGLGIGSGLGIGLGIGLELRVGLQLGLKLGRLDPLPLALPARSV